jgi:hypothetical protein
MYKDIPLLRLTLLPVLPPAQRTQVAELLDMLEDIQDNLTTFRNQFDIDVSRDLVATNNSTALCLDGSEFIQA